MYKKKIRKNIQVYRLAVIGTNAGYSYCWTHCSHLGANRTIGPSNAGREHGNEKNIRETFALKQAHLSFYYVTGSFIVSTQVRWVSSTGSSQPITKPLNPTHQGDGSKQRRPA